MTPSEFPWFAIRVKSRCEKQVSDQLRYKGYEEFLPMYRSHRIAAIAANHAPKMAERCAGRSVAGKLERTLYEAFFNIACFMIVLRRVLK